ncbi:MAG: hypothetical protein GKR99_14025 [Rhodobacteraceae bacterium]|nr:hypothetical protein [Paracoccaceae bacterium]
MFKVTCLVAFSLATVPSALLAEGMFGGAEFSFGQYSVDDTGDDEGTGDLATLEGYVGTAFGNGAFVEGEVRVKRASSLTDPGSNNGLREGQLAAFRFGRIVLKNSEIRASRISCENL